MTALAADADALYVARSGKSGISRLPFATFTEVPLASGLPSPIALTIDDANVYYAAADGTITRVPKDGAPASTFARGLVEPKSIAYRSGTLYVAVATGIVTMLTK